MHPRRHFLRTGAALGAGSLLPTRAWSTTAPVLVRDISGLDPTPVARIVEPRSAEDVAAAVRAWPGTLCIGGARYSMGGQIAAEGALHLDMRSMNRAVAFDPVRRTLRVQAGATWRDVQEMIDPHGLAVAVMQSYSNFTVGGSVGVNCHGRYVGQGPVGHTVRALQMVTAAGAVMELSPDREPALFRGAIGGYGGLGVITEVEIALRDNVRIERRVQDLPLAGYADHFRRTVLGDPRTVLHHADLRPPRFDAPRAVSWQRTDRAPTRGERLVPRGLDYSLQKNAVWAITEVPGGSWIRERLVEPRQRADEVVWLNREASLDAASLEPRTRRFATYLLQEYFVPIERFGGFALAMGQILQQRRVNALNVSVRHSPPDRVSIMRWAATEVFSLVLFYKQPTSPQGRREATAWTRELIDAALSHGGRYYLPYRPEATIEQFSAAYPEAREFAALKRRIDPARRLRNRLWDRYLRP